MSFVLVCLCSLFVSSAAPSVIERANTGPHSFYNIFFDDELDDVLFIDFGQLKEQVVEVNILRNSQLMMQDDVRDLPNDTIYEIHRGIMRTGLYTIELVMTTGIKIQKEISID